MLWIWGKFNASMDEEYVCMLKLNCQIGCVAGI